MPLEAPGHQGLEAPGRVLAKGLRHVDAVLPGALRPLAVLIEPGGVGDLLLVQDPHHIGLFLFFFAIAHTSTLCGRLRQLPLDILGQLLHR